MKNHTPRKKPKEKTLSYAQAKELKWFCGNVTGLRQEYYAALEQVASLGAKLARLERTVELIDNFFNQEDDDENEEWSYSTRRSDGAPIAAAADCNGTGPGDGDQGLEFPSR